MNILVVTPHYYPEHFQITEICETLVSEGHSVTVLTGLPNYPKGYVLPEYKKGKNRDEVINGVHVLRGFEIGRRHGIFWRLLNYYSFYRSERKLARKVLGDFDIVYAYSLSPITAVKPAIFYKKRRNAPVLLHCIDLWPESVKTIGGGNGPMYKIALKLSRPVYQGADKILVQSKSFIPYLHDVDGVLEERIGFLPQFADGSYLKQNFASIDDGITDFLFAGNVGVAQDMPTVFKAASLVAKTGRKFKIHIVGDGSALNDSKGLVKKYGLKEFVIFYGRQPYDKMPDFYRLADVCLAPLQGGTLISSTIPAKVQGYMAAGKPILACLDGFAKEVIENAKCGLCVTPGDYEDLSMKMIDFIDNPIVHQNDGDNGRSYFSEHFTKERFISTLLLELQTTIDGFGEAK